MTCDIARLLVPLAIAAGCQDDVATAFPPGLEPLEANTVADQDATDEGLRSRSHEDGDLIIVHGRGFVQLAPAALWQLTQQPAAMIATCSTSEQQVSTENDPTYEFSFLVHYIVRDILTVEWDDQWRYGVIAGTATALELGMIKHQKTQGSDFITLSEGTVQVLATGDPDVSELAFVEHLDAVSGGADDVLRGMQHNYDALVALAHAVAIPACP